MNLAQHQVILWRVRQALSECFGHVCWTHTWMLRMCYSRVLVEVDFKVCSYYNNLMNFLKGIKPFELINAIIDRNKSKNSKGASQARQSSSPAEEAQTRKDSIDTEGSLPMCDQNIDFLVSLRRASSDRQHCENHLRRKISLFQKVQVEPHYLSPADELKLLTFQFHLGSDIFLERVEHLHQQVTQINTVVKQVLATRKEDAYRYLQQIKQLELQISDLISRICLQRQKLSQLREHKVYRIQQIIRKKNNIKEQLRLLKNVKAKNQAAFLQINNIDQAFATEQARNKLYKKINKLTELQKSKYVCIIKNKLVSISAGNVRMVQQGLISWVQGKLSPKQIEKLSFMIYFIEREEIYTENNLKIDFTKANKQILNNQIAKIKEWKSFTYVKDLMTKDRIHEFLNYLLEKIKR